MQTGTENKMFYTCVQDFIFDLRLTTTKMPWPGIKPGMLSQLSYHSLLEIAILVGKSLYGTHECNEKVWLLNFLNFFILFLVNLFSVYLQFISRLFIYCLFLGYQFLYLHNIYFTIFNIIQLSFGRLHVGQFCCSFVAEILLD